MKLFKILLLALVFFSISNLNAQVAINTNGQDADASAMLDISSSNKGILIPRVALTGANDATTIVTPATSLLIYNTATASAAERCLNYSNANYGTGIYDDWHLLLVIYRILCEWIYCRGI